MWARVNRGGRTMMEVQFWAPILGMKEAVKARFLPRAHVLFQKRAAGAPAAFITKISFIWEWELRGTCWVVYGRILLGCRKAGWKHSDTQEVRSLPRRPRRWTHCHRTRTWPCAWGSHAAGGRASRGASAWRSSDWGKGLRWRRRWRSGPEVDIIIETPLDSNPPTDFQNTRKKEAGGGGRQQEL